MGEKKQVFIRLLQRAACNWECIRSDARK